jgi:hypothetical protein
MPEGTGPLRDLHPQILRRGARSGEFNPLQAQREACEPRTTKVGCACFKVNDGGFSGATMDWSGLRWLLADIAHAQREAFIASQRHEGWICLRAGMTTAGSPARPRIGPLCNGGSPTSPRVAHPR